MDFLERLIQKVQGEKKVLFPEGNQVEIIQAAIELQSKQLVQPILLSNVGQTQETAKEHGLSLDGIELISLEDEAFRNHIIAKYLKLSDEFSEKRLRIKWKNPLNAAAILLKVGYGDTMVTGISVATEEVILSAINFVGLGEGYTTPSSSFIMEIPNYHGPEAELLAFADCGVCVNPTAAELDEIGRATAETVQRLLGWEPRLAFLSFSTNGSGEGESAQKVRDAVEITKGKAPELAIVGEVQADAALIKSVADKKLPETEIVKGNANVLIFPNLDSGNIAYKLVQITSGGNAYGPILQGFAKPVADLSRGASVKDIIGTAVISSLLS